jgi:BirA family biotin operon repressor/biotin-[acetyl-CoA-carboxylase] ligase
MELPLTAAAASRLEFLDECGSTNTELSSRATGPDAAAWPSFSAVVTTSQTGGRGRLGRTWVAPPGRTVAISVLLRPTLASGAVLPLEQFGWLPLIAGVAMTRTVTRLVTGHSVTLKWPNDVLIDGLKVAGLLAELLPSRDAVVMGAGLNLAFTADELPTPTSTSVSLNAPTLEGDRLVDVAVSTYLTELRSLVTAFIDHGADPAASGISALLQDLCSTLGQRVKVQLPSGDELRGTAVDIDSTGRLRVRHAADTPLVAVAAGDVTHLRYE